MKRGERQTGPNLEVLRRMSPYFLSGWRTVAGCALVVLPACIEIKDEDAAAPAASGSPRASAAPQPATPDSSYISVPFDAVNSLDTVGAGARLAEVPAADSASAVISGETANRSLTRFPARIPLRGPMALHIQVLLDRANFSPGIVDGAWGKNAAKALAFFTTGESSGSAGSGTRGPGSRIDKATYDRLLAAARREPVTERYTVRAEDLRGPFVDIPDSVYQQAKLPCLCYSSPVEAIAERFHTSQKLLAQLNPGVNLGSLAAGTVLTVPNVDNEAYASAADTIPIARLIISREGFWTQAVDASGRILFHFPSTLGAGYDPSPTGDFRIVSVSRNPPFRYQPKLFAEVPDDRPEARLPPGPNSPVGIVWIGLSKPHYGIHGTSAPETIGYANSHGCVRLTNWDALQLSDLVESGTPVVFR